MLFITCCIMKPGNLLDASLPRCIVSMSYRASTFISILCRPLYLNIFMNKMHATDPRFMIR